MRDLELPEGIVPVGSLHEAIVRLDIPSCGHATIWKYEGVRYIQHSQTCPPKKLAALHRAYIRKVERLARKHEVPIDLQKLGVTIDRLRQKEDVRLPEEHSCQTGVLWLGPHHHNQRRAGAPDERPSWIVDAAQKLTKTPYSLLFSLIRLVTKPRPGHTFDACVPPAKVLAWCSMYGLPDTETSYTDERFGCLQLKRFQCETVILYLLFHLWKALIDWQAFEEVSGPSDPEEAERHRGAIHDYASLLLMLSNGGSLWFHVRREQHLKQQLDRGIYKFVDPKTKKEVDLKEEYKHAKAEVDHVAWVSIDEVVHARKRVHQYLSGATGRTIVLAPSVFDACYLQLGQLTLKPPGEVARHLKLCAVPACGWLFWAPHGNKNVCEEHPSRGARWAANHRMSIRRSAAFH